MISIVRSVLTSGIIGAATSDQVCQPKTPPKEIPSEYKKEDYQICAATYYVLDPFKSVTIGNRSADFGAFLNSINLDVYKLDKLTWKQAAAFVYGLNINDPKVNDAALVLQQVNGNAATPYDTLSSAEGASYRYYRFSTGNSFLGIVSCVLPNAGNVPMIKILVPPPAVKPEPAPAPVPVKQPEQTPVKPKKPEPAPTRRVKKPLVVHQPPAKEPPPMRKIK